MNSTEIKEILDRATELFNSVDEAGNLTIMLAFQADEEEALRELAEELDGALSGDGSYLEVSTAQAPRKCHLMLSVSGFGNPIVLEPVKYYGDTLKKLVEKEGNNEPVGFGFFIYSKEIERTEVKIQAAMAAEDYDEHQAVPADEPVYDSVRIAIKGGLQIRTDVG